MNPLSQTFTISDEGGVFIPQIDLFFAEKDTNIPAYVEIRDVRNGIPGKNILPFGRKVLEPANINIDPTTAAIPTTFVFDSPVYVLQGVEYCIVVGTQSLDYRIWISELGWVDVGNANRVVSSNPSNGVLYKSQNSSAWLPVQSQDLKFTLYKCNFSTNVGNVTLLNRNTGYNHSVEKDGITSVFGKRLLTNPIRLTDGLTIMRVYHRTHGMYSTSNNVTINGVVSGITTTLSAGIGGGIDATNIVLTSPTGFVASNLAINGIDQMFIKIDNEIIRGTLSGSTFTSNFRGFNNTISASHSSGATIELYQLANTPLTEINKTHILIANIEIDSYTIILITAPTITGTSTVIDSGGINVYATENYRFETFKTQISAQEFPNTKITPRIRTTTGTSPSGIEASFTTDTIATLFDLNENNNLDTTRIVCSKINETNELAGGKSLIMPITLSTLNRNISPVIDTQSMSMILVGNNLNSINSSDDVYLNYNASTEPDGDNNAAIYITKKIALENPATALKVFFAGNIQGTSEVEVLFKTLRSDSSDDFDELGYVYFNTDGSPDNTVAKSLATTDFQQYVYTAGVTDDGIGTPLPEFAQFAIKIVMKGTNAAQPPILKDLRAIALAL